MSKSKKNICPRCDKEIPGSTNYRRHVQYSKDCVGVLYTCKRCYQVFEKLQELLAHQSRTTYNKCQSFSIEGLTKQELQIRVQYKSGEKKPLEQKVTEYLHNITGEDDPIRIPRMIRLLELLDDEDFSEFISRLYKTLPEARVRLITALKSYNDSGKFVEGSKRKKIIDSLLKHRKLPDMD